MLARRILWSFLVAMIVTAPLAEAQQNFDVVVSGYDASFGCFIIPFIQPVQQWYGPDRTDHLSDVQTIASADGRRVLALLNDTPPEIVEIRPDGSQAPFYSGPAAAFGSSMTIAPDGTVFVSVGGVTPSLVRISAAGVLEATYPLTTDMIDVGPDGCTIYYRTGSNVIARVNGCTGAPLPDFTSLAWVNAFEVLPSGEVLVSMESEVRLYDASGALVRVVANLPAYGLVDHVTDAIALSGGVLYVAAVDPCDAGNSFLLRIALATGAELSRAPLAMTGATAIVVGNAVTGVPTLGETALALLALVLAAGGAMVLRLR